MQSVRSVVSFLSITFLFPRPICFPLSLYDYLSSVGIQISLFANICERNNIDSSLAGGVHRNRAYMCFKTAENNCNAM